MTTPEALRILKAHNEWRRSWEWRDTDPTELWLAIDQIIDSKDYMELIESITCLNWMEDDKTKAKLFDDIYMISHIANWRCTNPHEDWVKQVEELKVEYNQR